MKLNSLNKNRSPNGRLPASLFEFPDDLIKKIYNGYFTDIYFVRSRNIILNFKNKFKNYNPKFLMKATEGLDSL